MRKTKTILTAILLFLLLGTAVSVHADMGPKPTSDIEIVGLDEPYYFDLLVPRTTNEVFELNEDQILERIEDYYYREDFPDILNGYYDEDGFASYSLYTWIPHHITLMDDVENVFHIGYFAAPSTFKIAIVTESGDLIVSDIIEKQLFNAYFTFDLTDFSVEEAESTIYNDFYVFEVDDSVEEDIPIDTMVLQVILSVILTLIIEGLVLFAFKYRAWASYRLALIVNVITQAVLYVFIIVGSWYWSIFGGIGIFIIGEFLVFLIEIVVYRIWLLEQSKAKATWYALLANFLSMTIGVVGLAYLIDLLFN